MCAEGCGWLRSDVICEFPLRDMLAFHRKTGAEGTILVTQVGQHMCQIIFFCRQLDKQPENSMLRHATHQLSPVNAQQDLKSASIRVTYENTANCSPIDTYFSGVSGGGPIKVWSGGDGRFRQGGALCGKAQGERASWALPHGSDI